MGEILYFYIFRKFIWGWYGEGWYRGVGGRVAFRESQKCDFYFFRFFFVGWHGWHGVGWCRGGVGFRGASGRVVIIFFLTFLENSFGSGMEWGCCRERREGDLGWFSAGGIKFPFKFLF